MRDAAVGFQCPDCVKDANVGSRQNRAVYGGQRSADPRLTSYVLIGINAVVWLAIAATGGRLSRLVELLALSPTGRCTSASAPSQYYPGISDGGICEQLTSGDGLWHPGVADGAWWQLLTSAFTHVEIWHVAMNMFALFIFGPPWRASSAGPGSWPSTSSAASPRRCWCCSSPGPAPAPWVRRARSSASSAPCWSSPRRPRLNSQWLMQNLIIGVVITVVGWRQISWQGHLGGFLGGVVTAAVIAYAPKANRSVVQWAGLALVTLVLVALSFVRVAALA